MARMQLDVELFVFHHFAPKKSLHFVKYSISMVELTSYFQIFIQLENIFFNYQLNKCTKN